MKLSKVILENKKVVTRKEINMSNEDIIKLTEAITEKLQDYLDIENIELLKESVSGAIKDLLQNKPE